MRPAIALAVSMTGVTTGDRRLGDLLLGDVAAGRARLPLAGAVWTPGVQVSERGRVPPPGGVGSSAASRRL